MRKFLQKIAIYIFSILFLSLAADLCISHYLKKAPVFAAGEYLIWNDIYDGEIDSDIAIYGSSRAWVHIDPILMEKETGKSTYNFGVDGHTFAVQYLRHLEYLKHNPAPQYILVSLDIFSLEKETGFYNSEQLLPYALWNLNIYHYTKFIEGGMDWKSTYVPLYRYLGRYNEIQQARNNFMADTLEPPFRVKGYRASEETWNEDFDKAQENKESIIVTIDQAYQILFEGFLKSCSEKDIKVILVFSPVHQLGQAYVENFDNVIALYKKIANEFGVPFWDYTDDPICQETSYFYNTTHLNATGSILFTKKLSEELNTYLINNN